MTKQDYNISAYSDIFIFISFTNNNAKIQRQKPSHKKNTSGTVQTEAYFIFSIAHIYSQLGFFWSDLTVRIENTQIEEQSLEPVIFKGLAQKSTNSPSCAAEC